MGALKTPYLKDIADRILVHLKRMEADPVINKKNERGMSPYFHVNTYRAGAYVCVKYVSYQATFSLKKENALAYLARLDAGENLKHYVHLRPNP